MMGAPPLGPEEPARTLELAPRFGLDLRLPDGTPREGGVDPPRTGQRVAIISHRPEC